MKMLSKTPYVEGAHFVSSNGTDPQNMFNATTSEATTRAGDLVVVLAPGAVNAIGFAGLVGGSLSVVGESGGVEVFSYSQSLTADVITDYYEYFFEPFTQLGDVLVTDIPPFEDIQLTITITGGSTACGSCAFGRLYQLGDTQLGASVGINDYSTKETSEAGVTTLAPGPFSKRISANLFLENTLINRTQRLLADARATATFWAFADGTDFSEAYTVLGYYRDFDVVVSYPRHSLVSIEIEGLT